jgi:hypothetical protein
MNGADALQRTLASDGGAEGDRQHRIDRLPQPTQARHGTAPKRAVVRDAGGNQRVRKLQQQRAYPPDENDPFRVDAPGNACGIHRGISGASSAACPRAPPA